MTTFTTVDPHVNCVPGQFCLKPGERHPGPCKGWKRDLARVAPGVPGILDDAKRRGISGYERLTPARRPRRTSRPPAPTLAPGHPQYRATKTYSDQELKLLPEVSIERLQTLARTARHGGATARADQLDEHINRRLKAFFTAKRQLADAVAKLAVTRSGKAQVAGRVARLRKLVDELEHGTPGTGALVAASRHAVDLLDNQLALVPDRLRRPLRRVRSGFVATSHRQPSPTFRFDPGQLRDPHTGEWIDMPGGGLDRYTKLYGDVLDEANVKIGPQEHLTVAVTSTSDMHLAYDPPGPTTAQRDVFVELLPDTARGLADELRFALNYEPDDKDTPNEDGVITSSNVEGLDDIEVWLYETGDVGIHNVNQDGSPGLLLDPDQADELADALEDMADFYDERFSDGGASPTGAIVAADWNPIEHPRDSKGQFRRTTDRIAAVLRGFLAGRGSDGLQQFTRPQLRGAAKDLGIALPRGADEQAIRQILLDRAPHITLPPLEDITPSPPVAVKARRAVKAVTAPKPPAVRRTSATPKTEKLTPQQADILSALASGRQARLHERLKGSDQTMLDVEKPVAGYPSVENVSVVMKSLRARGLVQLGPYEGYKGRRWELTDKGRELATSKIVPPLRGDVRARVEQAILDQRGRDAWLGLADLRESLPDIPREDLDAALKQMLRDNNVRIIPVANSKALKPRDRAASLRIGDDDTHAIMLLGDRQRMMQGPPVGGVVTGRPPHPTRQPQQRMTVPPGDRGLVTAPAANVDNTPTDVAAQIAGIAAGRDIKWVSLTELRPRLAGTKQEQDATLLELLRQDRAVFVPESNQKVLTDADRAAAVQVGGQDKHLVMLVDPEPGGRGDGGLFAEPVDRTNPRVSSTLIVPTPTPPNPQSAWGQRRDEPRLDWSPGNGRPGNLDQVDRVYTAPNRQEARIFLESRDRRQLQDMDGWADVRGLDPDRDRAAYIEGLLDGIREPESGGRGDVRPAESDADVVGKPQQQTQLPSAAAEIAREIINSDSIDEAKEHAGRLKGAQLEAVEQAFFGYRPPGDVAQRRSQLVQSLIGHYLNHIGLVYRDSTASGRSDPVGEKRATAAHRANMLAKLGLGESVPASPAAILAGLDPNLTPAQKRARLRSAGVAKADIDQLVPLAKKTTPAKKSASVDVGDKFRAATKKLTPPFGDEPKRQWDDARLHALGLEGGTPEQAVQELEAAIAANEERLRRERALGIEPHLQRRTMRALPDDIERQHELLRLVRRTYGLSAPSRRKRALTAGSIFSGAYQAMPDCPVCGDWPCDEHEGDVPAGHSAVGLGEFGPMGSFDDPSCGFCLNPRHPGPCAEPGAEDDQPRPARSRRVAVPIREARRRRPDPAPVRRPAKRVTVTKPAAKKQTSAPVKAEPKPPARRTRATGDDSLRVATRGGKTAGWRDTTPRTRGMVTGRGFEGQRQRINALAEQLRTETDPAKRKALRSKWMYLRRELLRRLLEQAKHPAPTRAIRAAEEPGQVPPPEQPGGDPWLTAKLLAIYAIVSGERDVFAAFRSAIGRFLDFIRPRVLPHRGQTQIDPQAVYTAAPMWRAEVANLIRESVLPIFRRAFASAQRDAGETSYELPADFDELDFVRQYVSEVENRMSRVPDEVFAHIRADIDRGIVDGDDIPTIAARIERTLLDGGAEVWTNRAVTVARTESVAGHNGGAFAAHKDRPGWEKLWISTHDQRTRGPHRHWEPGHEGLSRRHVNEPFVVGGFPGMFPGDKALPADMSINCRCTAVYVPPGGTEVL